MKPRRRRLALRAIPLATEVGVCGLAAVAIAATQWLNPVPLSPRTAASLNPQVRILPSGSAVAIWTYSPGTGRKAYTFVASAFRPQGGHWGRMRVISEPGGSDNYGVPRLAAGRLGAVSVWTRSSGPHGDTHSVYVARMHADGRWTRATSLGPGSFASVATAGPVALVIAARAGPSRTSLVAHWFRGGRWDRPVIVASNLGPVTYSWVALNGPGTGAAVAEVGRANGNEGIYEWPIRRFHVGRPRLLNPDSDLGAGPADVCTSSQRSVVVVWIDKHGVRSVSGASRATTLDTGGRSPSCAVNTEGDALAGWIAADYSSARVAFKPTHGNWGAPVVVSGQQDSPSRIGVGLGSGGRAGAYWLAGSATGGPDTLQASIRSPSGAWSMPSILASSGLETGDLAMAAKQGPVIAWPQFGVIKVTSPRSG